MNKIFKAFTAVCMVFAFALCSYAAPEAPVQQEKYTIDVMNHTDNKVIAVLCVHPEDMTAEDGCLYGDVILYPEDEGLQSNTTWELAPGVYHLHLAIADRETRELEYLKGMFVVGNEDGEIIFAEE